VLFARILEPSWTLTRFSFHSTTHLQQKEKMETEDAELGMEFPSTSFNPHEILPETPARQVNFANDESAITLKESPVNFSTPISSQSQTLPFSKEQTTPRKRKSPRKPLLIPGTLPILCCDKLEVDAPKPYSPFGHPQRKMYFLCTHWSGKYPDADKYDSQDLTLDEHWGVIKVLDQSGTSGYTRW
jgi:hypothetical protein